MKGVQVREGVLQVLFFVYVCLSAFGGEAADLASDRAALLALRNAVKGRPFLWNTTEPTPCSWNGVKCENQRVTELRLPGKGLAGQLPLGIGNLTQLVTLSLRANTLSGPIPPDFANLGLLQNLYLQDNSFSGEIPGFIYDMQSLVHLMLANNNFSGEISPRINNLTRLNTLFLENNTLTGSIPNIDIPSLVQFNVSFNQLTGSVPEKLSGLATNAFQGNSLCGKPLLACPVSGSKLSGGAIAGIVIGSFVGFLIIVVLLIVLCRRKSGEKLSSKDLAAAKPRDVEMAREKPVAESESIGGSGMRSGGSKSLVFFENVGQAFDLEDLLKASAEVLGKGTFGTAYKATLENGIAVVVKRLKEVTVSEKEFIERIEEIGRMVHANLVPLRAYYYSREERLLVYDYMPLGSLSALLHGSRESGRTPLNWETRTSIALGAAHGIAYLHSRGPRIAHGNVKSSNILLTKSYEARVSDFGLARIALPTSTPNRIDGYRAPEVTDSQKVSQKADIYSFGVLLLELLTGKAPTHALLNEEGVDLPRWVQSVVQEEWTAEVFDVELLRYQSVEEEMVQLLQLALECTAQYPEKRPSMTEVTSRIQYLCHSSTQKEQDRDRVLFSDADDGFSPQFYSADSGAVPPST